MNEKELNIALGKLFNGIELKAEKVEFNAEKDIREDMDRLDKSFQEAQQKRILAQRIYHNTASKTKNARKFAEDAIRKAKELGVDFKIGEMALRQYDRIEKEASDYAKKLK